MIKVNLVPSEILAKAEQKQRLLQASAAGVILLVFLVLISLTHLWRLSEVKHQLDADNGRLKQLQVIVAKVEELEKTAAAVRARLNVVTALLRGRPLYPYFMSDFVRSVPSGVQVTSLSTIGGGSAAAPLKLTISGQARSNEDIADWVKRMEASGRFSNVELGAVTGLSGGAFSFSLKSVYTPQL